MQLINFFAGQLEDHHSHPDLTDTPQTNDNTKASSMQVTSLSQTPAIITSSTEISAAHSQAQG